MERNAMFLVSYIVLLSISTASMLVSFSWFDIVVVAWMSFMTCRHAKRVLDDHRVNHAIIGFVDDDDGNTRVKIVKQWHEHEFRK